MKKFLLVLSLAAVGAASQAAIMFDNIGPANSNFAGAGVTQAASANQSGNQITRMFAQKLIMSPSAAGLAVHRVQFSVANFNTAAVSVRARIRFFQTDGASGGPGTFIAGFSFNPISFGAGVTVVTGTLGAGLNVPVNSQMWAGLTFDNNTGGTGATAAQMDLMGQGLFNNPPLVGSTQDDIFRSTAAGSFLASNPAGTLGPAPFNNVNRALGWRVETTPEPATLAVLGVGALALIRRRKKA